MNPTATRTLVSSLSALGLLAFAAADASAITVVKAKTEDLNQAAGTAPAPPESPFFTAMLDGTATIASGGWYPAAPAQAAAATTTSTSPKKSFNFIGNSTSAGLDLTPGTADDWKDGNGIPAGITLTFDAQFTITALPLGSLLTHPGSAIGVTTPALFGRGIGVTGVVAGPNDINTGSGLDFSPVAVTNVNFSGTLTDTNFTFTPGSVANFGTIVFRSNNFAEATQGMLLTSGAGTIGFGTATGSIASNLAVNNNFGTSDPLTTSSVFARQSGPYTLVVTQGVGVIKGVGLGYDVTYDISPAATTENADFDGDEDIDGEDFLIWQRGVGGAGGTANANGNANGDAFIDGDDLAIWQDQFGTTPSIAAAAQIPEPAGVALLLVGSIAMLASSRRQS